MADRVMHFWAIVLVGAFVAFSSALTTDPAIAGPKTPGQLVIGLAQGPTNLHPAIEPHTAKTWVLFLGLRRLTVHDPDQQLVCELCLEVPTLANSGAKVITRPDGSKGMAVTFKLRPDAYWADGVQVTAADVVFSFEAGKRVDMGFQRPDVYAAIERVDAPNPTTAVVYFKSIQSNYNGLDWPILPAHLERDIVKATTDPADFRKTTLYNKAPTTPGLWNGPYRMTAIEPGASFTFEPNPYWKGKAPAFKRVIVRVIENTAALEQNLLSGDIDYIVGELGLTIDQALSLESRAADRFDFVYAPSLLYEHADFNLDNPILKDLKVRQALLLGLDRDAINTRLFKGKQPIAATFVNARHSGFDPEVKVTPYDPKQAAHLLDEAGWKVGAGGIRVNNLGKRLQLELMTTAGNKQRELVQTVLQSQWRQLGVDITIRNEPGRTLFGRTIKERKFTGLVMYSWSSLPDDPPSQTLASTSIPTEANNYSGSNYPGYANPEFDAAIVAAQQSLDSTAWKAAWSKMQRLYAADLPVLPLYFRADPFVIPKWLKGIRPTGHQIPSSAWIEDWYVAQ